MSKNFNKLIEELQSDSKLIGQFMANPEKVLEKAKVSSAERKALLARDIEALNDLGLTSSQAVGALSGAHSQRCSSNRMTGGY